MIEDILQTQPQTQTLPTTDNKPTRSADFQKYLNETTSDFNNTQNLQSKTKQSTLPKAENKIENKEDTKNEKKEDKKIVQKPLPNTQDLLTNSLSSEPNTPNTTQTTQLTQALKVAQEQSFKSAQDKESLKQSVISTSTQESSEAKTLQDIKNLAQQQGLNPTKIMALQEEETPKPQKQIPESAKQKIQYEVENIEDRVAVINRGTKKPQNITSKISNVYEEGKSDNNTLGSMLGLKDLPRQI